MSIFATLAMVHSAFKTLTSIQASQRQDTKVRVNLVASYSAFKHTNNRRDAMRVARSDNTSILTLRASEKHNLT